MSKVNVLSVIVLSAALSAPLLIKADIGVNRASVLYEGVSAPGQYANNLTYGNFESIVGAIGQSDVEGLPSKTASISLGSFGGYIVVGFEKPVKNDPRNPYGVDFSTAGNAFANVSNGFWCEPAAVMVMRDDNGNGLPDDTWYELAGSDYWWSTTHRNITMTYENPGYSTSEVFCIPYEASDGLRGTIRTLFPAAANYPWAPADIFSGNEMTLSGSLLTGVYDKRLNSNLEGVRPLGFGYTDNRTNVRNLSTPANPYYADGNGAPGEGFDISWAVDKDGNYVDLDHIDFVKIYTCVAEELGALGEASAEIIGICATTPDPTLTEPKDYYLNYFGVNRVQVPVSGTWRYEGFAFKNGRPMREAKPTWTSSNPEVGTIDENGVFTGRSVGKTTISFCATDLAHPDSFEIDVVEIDGVTFVTKTGAEQKTPMEVYVGDKARPSVQSLTTGAEDGVGSTVKKRYVYDTYEWINDSPEIIDMDEDGFFVAKAPGTATVTATSKTNPARDATIQVKVSERPNHGSDISEVGITEPTDAMVYSVGGALLEKVRLIPGETPDLSKLTPGVYLVNFPKLGRTTKVVKR